MIRITYRTPEGDADQPSREWSVEVDCGWNPNYALNLVNRLHEAVTHGEAWLSVLRVPVPEDGAQ